jgi:hypothetical protein
MITGPTPDTRGDYRFERLIPETVKGLKEQSKILSEVSEKLVQITGEKGEHAAVLDKVAVYLNRMGTYPTTIAGSMATLKDYMGNLGTWLTDTQNQPCTSTTSAFSPSMPRCLKQSRILQIFLGKFRSSICRLFPIITQSVRLSPRTLTRKN